MRDDLLQQLLGPYNADTVDSNDIAEKLLFLHNITITYTNTNKVSSITMWTIVRLLISIQPLLFLCWYKVELV